MQRRREKQNGAHCLYQMARLGLGGGEPTGPESVMRFGSAAFWEGNWIKRKYLADIARANIGRFVFGARENQGKLFKSTVFDCSICVNHYGLWVCGEREIVLHLWWLSPLFGKLLEKLGEMTRIWVGIGILIRISFNIFQIPRKKGNKLNDTTFQF